MKNGKKIKLDLNKVYKTNYGTVDNKNFKSTYITVSCWAEPNKEERGLGNELLNHCVEILSHNCIIQ